MSEANGKTSPVQRIVMWLRGERLYRVSYIAVGMMGNKYTAGTLEFSASRKEIKEMGTVANVGFLKNFDFLRKHYKTNKEGYINYASITHT